MVGPRGCGLPALNCRSALRSRPVSAVMRANINHFMLFLVPQELCCVGNIEQTDEIEGEPGPVDQLWGVGAWAHSYLWLYWGKFPPSPATTSACPARSDCSDGQALTAQRLACFLKDLLLKNTTVCFKLTNRLTIVNLLMFSFSFAA